MNTQKFKIVIDILLTAALLLLMPYELVGEAAHEWIGVGMFVILIIHHILNRKWTGHIGKGKYTPVRIMQTILGCLLVLSILGSMLSGIILSRHIRIWILRILGAAVALYGAYTFGKRNIASYLFLRVHFVFFDYSEPVIFYILDYAAAMGMLIFLGYYLNKGLQSIYRKVHTE